MCVGGSTLIWKALKNKGIHVAYVKYWVIYAIDEGEVSSVRMSRGIINDYPLRIGLHQGSALNLYLFKLVLDVLAKLILKKSLSA